VSVGRVLAVPSLVGKPKLAMDAPRRLQPFGPTVAVTLKLQGFDADAQHGVVTTAPTLVVVGLVPQVTADSFHADVTFSMVNVPDWSVVVFESFKVADVTEHPAGTADRSKRTRPLYLVLDRMNVPVPLIAVGRDESSSASDVEMSVTVPGVHPHVPAFTEAVPVPPTGHAAAIRTARRARATRMRRITPPLLTLRWL
jgi:hypothetical protein